MPAMGRWHHQREEIVRDSGIPATFLRPGGFMTNAFDWAPTIRAGGYVIDPIGPGRYAPIDPADIAAVAALCLTEDGHEGKAYVPTGDERITVGRIRADPRRGDRPRHRGPRGGDARRGRPGPLPQRGAAGPRRRHHRRASH